MRCTACNYPLWDLRDRVCPECGTEFLVSRFVFAPGCVRAVCPHCNASRPQDASDRDGPAAAFTCETCRAEVPPERAMLRVAPGCTEAQAIGGVDAIPWIDATGTSWWSRWAGTNNAMLQSHVCVVTRLKAGAPTWAAITYNLSTAAIIAAMAVLVPVSLAGVHGVVVGLVLTVVAAGGSVLWALCTSTVVHAMLRPLVDAADGSTPKWSMMFQAACYSTACWLLLAIPIVGVFLTPLLALWWLAVFAEMVEKLYSAGVWKSLAVAALAGVSPFAVVAGLLALASRL